MNKMRKLIAASLMVFAASAYCQTPFEIDRSKIESARKSGDITIVEEQQEILAAAKIGSTDYGVEGD